MLAGIGSLVARERATALEDDCAIVRGASSLTSMESVAAVLDSAPAHNSWQLA